MPEASSQVVAECPATASSISGLASSRPPREAEQRLLRSSQRFRLSRACASKVGQPQSGRTSISSAQAHHQRQPTVGHLHTRLGLARTVAKLYSHRPPWALIAAVRVQNTPSAGRLSKNSKNTRWPPRSQPSILQRRSSRAQAGERRSTTQKTRPGTPSAPGPCANSARSAPELSSVARAQSGSYEHRQKCCRVRMQSAAIDRFHPAQHSTAAQVNTQQQDIHSS